MTSLTIADEGDKVVLVLDGRRMCDMPPELAREIAKHLTAKASKIEEIQNFAKIVTDQAILQRSGASFGLSSNPKIQREAKKEAEWGNIRRYMPLRGIEPRAVLGTPSLRKWK